jgi:hypothetical protein
VNKLCDFCGSDKRVNFCSKAGMNLCHRHETQFRYCGELKELTRKDKNNINIFGKIAKIILRNNKFDVVGEAIIDSEDVCRVKDLKWSLHRGYAVNNKIKHVALHQVIFGMKNSPQIDHINRNKLDNRKKNLREATFRLNIINRDVQLNNKSTGVKGNLEQGFLRMGKVFT